MSDRKESDANLLHGYQVETRIAVMPDGRRITLLAGLDYRRLSKRLIEMIPPIGGGPPRGEGAIRIEEPN